jgi:hypothetical protein
MTLPELSLIGATRVALGVGLAFLLADRISRDHRVAVGWTLLTIGALSTIPLAFEVLGRDRLASDDGVPDRAEASPVHTAHGALRPSKAFVW